MTKGILKVILLLTLAGGLSLCKTKTTNYSKIVKADYGSQERVFLDENTEVRLNAGSSISYSEEGFKNDRKVILEGEAIFTIQKNSPITIEATNGTVTSSDGHFNVRTWGKNLYIECYGGKASILPEPEKHYVTKYQSLNTINGVRQKKDHIKNQVPMWAVRVFKFYDEELNIVFDEVERQFDIKVTHENDRRLFTGSFTKKSLEQALKSITKSMQLTYEISEDRSHVTIKK